MSYFVPSYDIVPYKQALSTFWQYDDCFDQKLKLSCRDQFAKLTNMSFFSLVIELLAKNKTFDYYPTNWFFIMIYAKGANFVIDPHFLSRSSNTAI